MHLRIMLGLLGQLLAVPAALFLLPSTSPDLGTKTASTTEVDVVDDVGLKISQEETVQGRLGELARSTKDGARRNSGDATTMRGGEGSVFSPAAVEGRQIPGAGLEELKDSLGYALENFMDLLNDIPRRAGDAIMTMTGRGPNEVDAQPESDTRNRYFTELRLAQESAEKALSTPGWAEVTQRNGITVWKKYFSKEEYGYQYPCVKARGIIDGSAEEVMGMIIDSTRVLEYNRYSKGRTDIEHLGPNTKIVWNKAQPPLSSKLHDFCTLMHLEPLEDGAFMLLTRATEHPEAPLLDGHVRSEILLGVTILRPARDDPSRTEMTTVNHIVSNGVPVMIADRVSTKNAIDFIQNVESAALAAVASGRTSSPAVASKEGGERISSRVSLPVAEASSATKGASVATAAGPAPP